MGEVKEEIHGTAPKHKAKTPGAENIVKTIKTVKDEISALVVRKDEDVAKEGDNYKAENLRKAGTLRAVHSLLTTIEVLLEGY